MELISGISFLEKELEIARTPSGVGKQIADSMHLRRVGQSDSWKKYL
jgi:hypothetical protein